LKSPGSKKPGNPLPQIPTTSFLQFEAFEILPEFLAEVCPFQRELHGRFRKAQFVAGVVARPFELVGVNRFAFEKSRIPSVSWISPPLPERVFSRMGKISGLRTYLPMIAMFDGASLAGGFSTTS